MRACIRPVGTGPATATATAGPILQANNKPTVNSAWTLINTIIV